MIYGNAELMGIPWESIIKIYRNKLGKQRFDSLEEYAQNLISFLENNTLLFPEDLQKANFLFNTFSYFNIINEEIREEVSNLFEENDDDKGIDDQDIKDMVSSVIEQRYEMWDQLEFLPTIPENYVEDTIEKYQDIIQKVKDEVFEKLPISKTSFEQLKKISVFLSAKDRFPINISGIAIAGFGEKEIFPSLISFIIEDVVNNKLKYQQDRTSKIGVDSTASIVPFAQSQMVATFMEGIDPFYRHSLEVYLSKLFDEYPEIVAQAIPQLNENEKRQLTEKLKNVTNEMLVDFDEEMQEYRQVNHVHPIISAVAVLPKDELAEMAESLVNLTSFKQKISLDMETVGGPIDVAVISKGDGFIWIKRKHYFKKELNPYFFANYYRDYDD
jgi:hypothetical protein